MPSIQKRKYRDGSTAFMAWVRIKPFKPVSKSFQSKTEAKDWAEKLEKELKAQKRKKDVRRDLASLTIKGLITEYLDDPTTRALETYDDKHRLACWWIEHYGATTVLDFGVYSLREARTTLSRGREAGTVNRYLSEMRSAWNWGRASGIVPKNEVWPARLMLREPRGRVRYLNDDELARVDRAARKQSPAMHAAIMTAIGTGLRLGELLRLKESDLDLAGKNSPNGPRLQVLESKNDEPRMVHLPSVVVTALREYLAAKSVKDINGALFTLHDGTPLKKGALYDRWNVIRKEAQLKNYRWHDNRHTCASLLAQGGATLLEIGATLGHRSASATSRYAHLVQGEANRGHANLNARLDTRR